MLDKISCLCIMWFISVFSNSSWTNKRFLCSIKNKDDNGYFWSFFYDIVYSNDAQLNEY